MIKKKYRNHSMRKISWFLDFIIFRKIQFQCFPLQMLKALKPDDKGQSDEHESYRWHSFDDEPLFSMIPVENTALRGWYMIELLLNSSHKYHTACFNFDFGKGFTKRHAISLPLESGKLVKRLCYLHTQPVELQFAPTSTKSDFSIKKLAFVRVSRKFALNRMQRKISQKSSSYYGMSLKSVRNSLLAESKKRKIPFSQVLACWYSECFRARNTLHNYDLWIQRFEAAAFKNIKRIKQEICAFKYQPLITVVLPVFNIDGKYLKSCIDSILTQSYSNWELCIADDASTMPQIHKLLQAYADYDSRIKIVFREKNGHISEASNSALSMATGDFVALLDHDDEFAEHALYAIVKILQKQPHAQIIYSDEDKIDASGNRSNPHFKPDWNPDLLLSQNYISHLCVYRRELIDMVGGFRKGLEGSQDYDLLLRSVDLIKPEQIVHIPLVLYHWRELKGSAALDSAEKVYTTKAGIQALEDRLFQNKSVCAISSGDTDNIYRVQWAVPYPAPMVSLIIPTRDGYRHLRRCVESILNKTEYLNFEILIVNNDSKCSKTIGYLRKVSRQEKIRVIDFNKAFNFSKINNFAVRQANGEIIGLVNDDIEVISHCWLSEMVSHAVRPDIGCVGAKLLYGNDQIQHAGIITGIGGVAGHSHKNYPKNAAGYMRRLQLVQNLSAVTAACLLVRKEIYNKVGGMNEKFLKIAFNDVDFCLRVGEAGYRNLWTPFAELYHHESTSRGIEDTPAKKKRFSQESAYMKKRWKLKLLKDPAYNPNLTLVNEDFSINSDRSTTWMQ